jgi:lipoyl(octanoyl) transferase
MSWHRSPAESWSPAAQVHLLGLVDFDECLALQQRLVYETSGRRDGQITLLVCEHAGVISVGRQGSRGHIHLSQRELASLRHEVRWVNRGGGCVLHSRGQLAVYAIAPLERHAMSPGSFAGRFQAGLLSLLAELNIEAHTHDEGHGIWGRSGHLVQFGIAVKNWTTYHGAFVNVAPAMHLLRLVESDPWQQTRAGSLVAERQQPIRMSAVRESLVRHVTAAFGCERFHLYAGHPLLPQAHHERRTARVG